jgi:hypothetical protein
MILSAQSLLDQLLKIQKDGHDLNDLDVQIIKTHGLERLIYLDEEVEVDGNNLNIYISNTN